MRRLFITLSKVYPKDLVKQTRKMINYSGIDAEAEIWLGESLFLGFWVFFSILALSQFGNSLLFTVLAFVLFAVYLVTAYSIPLFLAEKRAGEVEEVLPSALQMMSSNIRAGMTPFQAMKYSSREEFGILKYEIDRATTKALGTGSFSDAIRDMTEDIMLPALERSVKLFIRSIESGGQLAKILDETARDITDNIILRKELLSATKTYTILILLTTLFGAPFLFNISIHFTERLNDMRETFTDTDVSGLGVGYMISESFSTDFLINISAFIVIITSFIASLLIGVIVRGKEKYGLKYAFFLVPVTLSLFYIIRHAVVVATT